MRSVLIGAEAVGRRSKFESGKCLAVMLPADSRRPGDLQCGMRSMLMNSHLSLGRASTHSIDRRSTVRGISARQAQIND
jgi:hypothetical protein